jgi:uncharacterized protein YciI
VESGALYVVLIRTRYASMAEAQHEAPAELRAHIERTAEWHRDGRLLLAGAFLDRPDEPVQTMAVVRTKDDADAFVAGDPFVLLGMVESSEIRPVANLVGA